MAASRTAIQRARFRFFLRILGGSAVVGALYGASVSQQGMATWISMLVGAANGVGIAGCISAIEIFVLREGSSMKRLLGLPFILVVALKTALYAGIVSFFVLAAPRLALLFPGSERRFFLFVDVVGSTAIAERLGPLQAHRFLGAVFSAIAEPVASSEGEIYQYVGDEIVVTWTEADGRLEARPLRCFFLMEEALRGRRAHFLERFSTEPALRAALPLGEVIAGEVGELRRAIVYHGDVMNTASRLEQATRELGVRFIASADALQALGPLPEVECRDLGALALRGRKEPIRASGISLRDATAG